MMINDLSDQEKIAECPECNATWLYIKGVMYCGVCSGDVGRDVRVTIRPRRKNEHPEFINHRIETEVVKDA